MKVKRLKEQFGKFGCEFRQVMRDENKAIYEEKCDGVIVAYEVIKIIKKKTNPNSYQLKKSYEEGYDYVEVYPSSEQFGSYGWSFGGKDKWEYALECYNRLPSE